MIRFQPRLRAPLLWPSPRVHQDHPTARLRANRGHLLIPTKTAHIVHNLRARFESRPRRRRLVGVHRNNRVGPLFENRFEHRQQPRLLFLRTYCRR